MADIEEVLTGQVAAVVGDVGKYEDLVSDLASDIVYFDSWYGVEIKPGSPEVFIDYKTPLVDLVDGHAERQLLAKTIRRYVMAETELSVNADEVVRLAMDRIVNWGRWYPAWWEDQNYRAFNEEEGEYDAVYDESDYGQGDLGVDGAF